ncbi:type III secretion system export apparatus subunit SctT [Microvirgula curvata]|uniref:EscT/YscT/HrcT family type III secretion system export apparatus protein n=1 Tax=Microvirgula aerodenitrificans TaxID=57480 RepID=A0A2S0P8Y9_9NEIS|nr:MULTISPECIES: type III secretion system export apparatus subunit SctT [Microvirgula]AVY93826.1 EscT/YscT/HrcT family type III secretion system export apparatus protein [Microvirgula aerodenitrificans]RAS14209.1 type III secretion protein T [Microvirgula sp. AG722]
MADVTGWVDWLPVLALCMLRPLGVMLLVPIFNAANLGGALVRNALVLMMALPLLPLHASWTLATGDGVWGYALLAAGELCIGLLIGFCAALPFWALDMAGFLIDTLRGSSMASVFNPLLAQQSSYLGVLLAQVFGLLFLVSGGFNVLIAALYQSYAILPPGQGFPAAPGVTAFLVAEWQLMYELCLRFSMPALVGFLLIDMAFGFANHSTPQLNVFFLSMPIKSVFALLMLVMSLGFAFDDPLDRAQSFAHRVRTLLVAP